MSSDGWRGDGPVFDMGDFLLGPRVEVRQFDCASCGAICMTTTPEAEVNREYLESGQTTSGGISSVCDDCYKLIMARARECGLIHD